MNYNFVTVCSKQGRSSMCQEEFSSARHIDPTKYGVPIAHDANGHPWHCSTCSLTTICGGFYHDPQAQINLKRSLRKNILCTCQIGPVFLESKPLIFRITQSGSAMPFKAVRGWCHQLK